MWIAERFVYHPVQSAKDNLNRPSQRENEIQRWLGFHQHNLCVVFLPEDSKKIDKMLALSS